jgi:hypothetical protein
MRSCRSLLLLLAVPLLVAVYPRPAFAEDSCTIPPSEAPGADLKCATTAKKVVVASLFGASLVSYGIAVGYELRARSYVSSQEDLAERAGGDQFVCRQGLSSEACLDYANASEDASRSAAGRNLFLVTGSVAGMSAVVTMLLWPNRYTGSRSVSLAVTPVQGGSIASVSGLLPF